MKTFPKPLTVSEEKAFLMRFRDGDMDARDTLIERNMRLVAHVVKKYGMQEREAEDLISVGTIGLIKAVNTYDMDKGSRLATYAAKCIDNAIPPQMGLRRRISLLWTKAGRHGRFSTGFRKFVTFFAVLWKGMFGKKALAKLLQIDPNSLRIWEAEKKRMNKKSWEKYFKDRIFTD